MKEPIEKIYDLGRTGKVTLHLTSNRKRLLMKGDIEPEGLDKAGLNALIDALKSVRDKVER
jgi:hypothetical protein